jgi:hypothetical protein
MHDDFVLNSIDFHFEMKASPSRSGMRKINRKRLIYWRNPFRARFLLLVSQKISTTSNTMKPNPIIQCLFPGSVIGAKVDGISLMQVHPLDPFTLIHLPSAFPVTHRRLAATSLSAVKRNSNRTRQRPAFTIDETRHHFAIEALDKFGPFRPQPYLYTCVRCRWMFRINDARGSVIALDGLGRRLPEPENTKRVVTFHRGSCPAFPVVEHSDIEPASKSTLRNYLSAFVDALRSLVQPGRHRSRDRREQPPVC